MKLLSPARRSAIINDFNNGKKRISGDTVRELAANDPNFMYFMRQKFPDSIDYFDKLEKDYKKIKEMSK